jgi:hypothetical protein
MRLLAPRSLAHRCCFLWARGSQLTVQFLFPRSPWLANPRPPQTVALRLPSFLVRQLVRHLWHWRLMWRLLQSHAGMVLQLHVLQVGMLLLPPYLFVRRVGGACMRDGRAGRRHRRAPMS